jgi:hypothetical protein
LAGRCGCGCGDGGAVVHHGDELVAEAHPATVGLALPGTASPAQARAAATRSPLFQGHPFPTCFTCGPDRAPGDGLRIFPGPLAGGDLWAAPWTPDPSVADQDGLVESAVIWAALDCPSGFAAGVGDTTMVLGRMAARVLARPRADTAYCLVAWRTGPADGRKQPARSALLDAHGRVLAVARTIWVTIPRPEPTPRPRGWGSPRRRSTATRRVAPLPPPRSAHRGDHVAVGDESGS